MIVDMEENKISLLQTPNSHILILGSSGYGKTYFLCRQMEEKIEEGKKIFLLDYSCSFTEEELVKNKFRCMKKTKIVNLFHSCFEWKFRGKDLAKTLSDTLDDALEISSYNQSNSLFDGVEGTISKNGFFTLSLLNKKLERLCLKEKNQEVKKNIERILRRMKPYADIENIQFCQGSEDGSDSGNRPALTILQISDYTEKQREFMVKIFMEMLWKEARNSMKRADIIALDEFQNVSMKSGSALPAMLREGRKFGISVYLSSQFFGNYNQEETDTLMQAANKIFFRPTENDLKLIAKFVNPNDRKFWEYTLNKLRIGEMALKGRYSINGNKRPVDTPIVCRIQ